MSTLSLLTKYEFERNAVDEPFQWKAKSRADRGPMIFNLLPKFLVGLTVKHKMKQCDLVGVSDVKASMNL